MTDYTDGDIKNVLSKYIKYLQENPIQYCVSG